MAAYLVVTLEVSDTAAFGAYRDAIAGLEADYGGRYLIRAPLLERLEGDGSDDERVVVMEFPDSSAARAFIASDAYQAAKRLRARAATLNMRLVTEEL
jgi:uncharacterized protein (DUF1330 family)